MTIVKATRSNHSTTICGIDIGTRVAMMHGTKAEKKMMAEIETTPITNFSTMSPLPATAVAGRNISAIPSAAASLASCGSGRRTSHAKG